MSYLDIGYNEFLERSPVSQQTGSQLDPLQFEDFTQEISGSKIQGGVINSQNEEVVFDLENDTFVVTDKKTELVRLGKKSDLNTGYVYKDKNGAIVLDDGGIYPTTFAKVTRTSIGGGDADHQLRLDTGWNFLRPIPQLTQRASFKTSSIVFLNLILFGAAVTDSWGFFTFRVNRARTTGKVIYMTDTRRHNGALIEVLILDPGEYIFDVYAQRIGGTASEYFQVENVNFEVTILGR